MTCYKQFQTIAQKLLTSVQSLLTKFILISVIGISFLIPGIAKANIVISEVMYDLDGSDSGREWVEITNDGGSLINIEGWKFFEADVNHTLKIINGSFGIEPNSSAVIVSDPDKFLIDWPSFEGVLIDSSFSLSNSGETITIRDSDLVDTDSFTYTGEEGASGDGNTLHKLDGEIKPGSPTPGINNYAEPIYTQEDSEPLEDSNVSAHTSSTPISFAKEINSISINPGRERVALVGMPITLETRAINEDNSKQYVDGVSYEWSLGDGSSQSGRKIMHSYLEPGDYVVVVKAKFREDIAVSRTKVKVYPFYIKINDVVSSEYIELRNNLPVEANIGGASLTNGNAVFNIVSDTIILPRTNLRIPVEIALIDLSNEVILRDALGRVVSQHTPSLVGEVLGASISINTPQKVIENKNKINQPLTLVNNKDEGAWFVSEDQLVDINEVEESDFQKRDDKVSQISLVASEDKLVISKEKTGFWKKTLRFFKNIF